MLRGDVGYESVLLEIRARSLPSLAAFASSHPLARMVAVSSASSLSLVGGSFGMQTGVATTLAASRVLIILCLASLVSSQTCGSQSGSICASPTPCCSNLTTCGSTATDCGQGCDPQYSAPAACLASNVKVSSKTDLERCGVDPNTRVTYARCSTKEYCCSPFGYCGIGDQYCVGCQKAYGRCPSLCDPSKPCGTIGKFTFAASIIALCLAICTMLVQCAVLCAK